MLSIRADWPTPALSDEPHAAGRHRWRTPFAAAALDARTVSSILSYPVFSGIHPGDFPADLSPDRIIANDARIVRFDRGETVYRQGEQAGSVFIVLRGRVKRIIAPADPSAGEDSIAGSRSAPSAAVSRLNDLQDAIRLTAAGWLGQGKPRRGPALNGHETVLGANEIFGVAATMTRAPRGCSIVACADHTQLLEVSWSGVRDLKTWSAGFGNQLQESYREQSSMNAFRKCRLFDSLDHKALDAAVEQSVFETYGDMNWAHRFQRKASGPRDAAEPVILRKGQRLAGPLLVSAGLVRVTDEIEHAELTVGFLKPGDIFGLAQARDASDPGTGPDTGLSAEFGLRACGYADVLHIPDYIAEACRRRAARNSIEVPDRQVRGDNLSQPFLNFIVDNRFINGTSAMAINTDRCVNCDDCVSACAATHAGVPRFRRKGKSHQNLLLVNACMHCADPVCMIDCPTGAIRRAGAHGAVAVDAATCIGCGACANACPYDNIFMERKPGLHGVQALDADGCTGLTAVKCDLCVGVSGGPACKRACPHDAISRVDIGDPDMLPGWLEVVR